MPLLMRLAILLVAMQSGAPLGASESAQWESETSPMSAPAGTGVSGMTPANIQIIEQRHLDGVLVAYAFHDPWSPAWRVDVSVVDEDRIRLGLSMRTFISGGEGEARQVFMRNARWIAAEQGSAEYSILSYEEGIRSQSLFAKRVAGGVIFLEYPGSAWGGLAQPRRAGRSNSSQAGGLDQGW
ncbi:MAG: hypothetical protein EOM91_09315 [Sphingobacteriia bacterium]|nr:hypothetical protein [Sphingobacteriia bacterium]NCC39002.1 hypothetical protein [Gammaproteobacteria bacterium]